MLFRSQELSKTSSASYSKQGKTFLSPEDMKAGIAHSTTTTSNPSPGKKQVIRQDKDGNIQGIYTEHTPDAERKDADRTAANRARIESIPGREKEAGIAAQAKMDEELRSRRVAKEEAASKDAERRAANYARMQSGQAKEREAGVADQLKQEEEVRERAARQAARNNEARQKWRSRAEKRFQREVYEAEQKFKDDMAGIHKTSSTSQQSGIHAERIKAHQDYINRLNSLYNRAGMGTGQKDDIRDRIRNAGRGIRTSQAALGSIPPPESPNLWQRMMGGDGRWLNRGLKGWTPEGFMKNTLTAGGWMAAVSGIMKVTELVDHSIKRMMELQLQTAVLRQTFRGVGGTAGELADDVLKLAAAEGRGSEEAMKAAIHWTRLGLDRRQAAEATRVSLIAANVAEMSADEATEKLSSVMATYNLQVSELNGTLGMLSRTSQTYRVTTGDLLDGLSRVSNIAKEAGMSLAQLQGLMGALVQKTGLSGERVANALQIFLNRINNPDVQSYFERNYKTQLTGGSKDLAEIREIYMRASDEEKKLIAIKVGTPRQSNIFTAMMDVYPEMDKAASSSLHNMNAALEENLKVTNTAHAAVERLKASWDRLVNSPSVDGFFANELNQGAGVIQALNNMIGPGQENKKPTYNNPQGANWKGIAKWIIPRMTGPLGYYMSGDSDHINKDLGISETPVLEGDTFKNETDPILAHEGHAKGYDYDAKIAAQKGDKIGEAEAIANKKKELKEAEAGRKSLEERLNKYKKEDENFLMGMSQTDSDRPTILGNIKTLENEILELKRSAYYASLQEEQVIDKTEGKMEEMTRVLTEQKMLASDFSESLKGLGAPKWVEEMVSTQGQFQMLTARIADMDKMSRKPGSDKSTKDYYQQTADALRKEMLPIKARKEYLESDKGAYYQREQTALGVTQKMTGYEIAGQGVGYTEGEKLLDKRKWLMQEVAKFNADEKMGRDQAARAIMMVNSLLETEHGIQQRILNIDKERHQVMIETQREFQKSLITAGPGDILRKLATASLMQGGKVGAGQFFSMSGEMRGDAYNLMGGEGMSKLNREKQSLAGQRLSLPNMQSITQYGQDGMYKLTAQLGDRLSVGADAAARGLDIAAQAANRFADAVNNATSRIAGIAGTPGPQTITAPSAAPVPQAVPNSHGATVTNH